MTLNLEHNDTALRMQCTFNAPPERVFTGWTDPDTIRQCMGCGPVTVSDVAADPRPGGVLNTRMSFGNGIGATFNGRYHEVVPGRRVVYSWTWGDNDALESMGETRVCVELTPLPGGRTDLRAVLEAAEGQSLCEGAANGWRQSFEKLAALVES